MKIAFFLVGILLLIGVEIARVYYIMPFPGSQVDEVIDLAYFLHQNILLFRLLGIVIIAYPAFYLVREQRAMIKWTAIALLGFWAMVFYAFNFRFLADKMFYQPESVILLPKETNKVPLTKLVLGVSVNGQAKSYPIEIIGYHHQVRDTLGGKDIMITYCTVCRTGRVFDPRVDGKLENFRLVGMDHFNAMFEDNTTKSWWRQVSGEAITGPLKGKALTEIPSQQMALGSWLELYPNSKVLQPDPKFQTQYDSLSGYDNGTKKGSLEGTDSLSWKDKSWVVGILQGGVAKAYDWNALKKSKIINDTLQNIPILLTIEKDGMSHHSFSRIVNDDTLSFHLDADRMIVDDMTQSIWNERGHCVFGTMEGTQLQTIQSYQEFWHSWRTFHPGTKQYGNL